MCPDLGCRSEEFSNILTKSSFKSSVDTLEPKYLHFRSAQCKVLCIGTNLFIPHNHCCLFLLPQAAPTVLVHFLKHPVVGDQESQNEAHQKCQEP